MDRAAWGSADGIRAIKVSTFGLAATAAVQFAIAALGGSVALLADGLHNLGDVFTTVALWVAFRTSRRAADRRYTFGYDRFEDLAGVGIVPSSL
ncbi:MAG: cation transporter [Candidatus Dormibacteria bacterium]